MWKVKSKNIYAISNRKKTKDADADRMLEYIWDNYNMLPFAERWLRKEWDKTGDLLQFLVKKKCVRAYPVLIEANGKKVAQAEHTFIPQTGSAIVTTAAVPSLSVSETPRGCPRCFGVKRK